MWKIVKKQERKCQQENKIYCAQMYNEARGRYLKKMQFANRLNPDEYAADLTGYFLLFEMLIPTDNLNLQSDFQ